ncbi:ATP-dependent DNA helicase [Sandarakinorhabdus sp.]|uniref:ATP-dependent DNA helicase n=1 Tax=Sandarakinorhabdus sp. TaxID=1916663 RepID=UPI003F6E783F
MSNFILDAMAARTPALPLIPEQHAAINAILAWLGPPGSKPRQQVFRLNGPAGTGKTTIMRELRTRQRQRLVLFGAFTGKAASVLRQKGCDGAKTLHSLVMKPIIEDRGAGKVLVGFEPNPDSIIKDAGLLVIDECSMVDHKLGRTILGYDTPVLVVGDPMQLPPPTGAGYFTTGLPDFTLKSVHRQDANTLLFELTRNARTGWRGDYGSYGTSRIIRPSQITLDDIQGADQILVGRNATRRHFNSRIRQLLGHDEPWPVLGDKLVCRRNNAGRGFWNGTTWRVVSPSRVKDDKVSFSIVDEDAEAGEPAAEPTQVTLDVADFIEPSGEPATNQKRPRDKFEYAYAITVHMAQGSQWPHILLIDEAECMGEDAQRWFYTAVSRASNCVTIAR